MKLFSPNGQVSRPITDRVKQSLFNVLQKYGPANGKVVADLFCGVGSLGLESLSRGAQAVTFVEQNPRVLAVLKRNIEKAGFIKQSTVIRADAFKTGAPPPSEAERYDIVFVDPPYAETVEVLGGSRLANLLRILIEQIKEDGIIVVRTRDKTILPDIYGRLKTIERRRWGEMALTILGLRDDE